MVCGILNMVFHATYNKPNTVVLFCVLSLHHECISQNYYLHYYLAVLREKEPYLSSRKTVPLHPL